MSSIWTIRRSATDAKLAGLCGGVARHWGIDPLLVRVGWALLALSGGVGVILYAVGWLMIPVEGKEKAPVDDMFGDAVRKWPRELWVTLLVVACVVFFVAFGKASPFSVGPAVIIALIWYFGFYRPRSPGRAKSSPTSASPAAVPPAPGPSPVQHQYPGPPTAFTEAAAAWQRRMYEHNLQVVAPPTPPPSPQAWPTAPAYPAPVQDPETLARDAFFATPDPVGLYAEPDAVASTPPPAPARLADRRSAKRLRLVGLLILAVSLSGLGVVDYLGAAIPASAYAAVGLLVIGIMLVAATWLGRARGILPLGVLLTGAVLVLSALGPQSVGLPMPPLPAKPVAYQSVADLPPGGDALDFGDLSVDLRDLTLNADATYSARVDAGNLDVVLPPDVPVIINYAVDFGRVEAFDRRVPGRSELRGVIPDPQPARPGRPTLTLNLAVDVGSVEVRR